MRKILPLLVVTSVTAPCFAAAATPTAPVAGSFGFDWLKPDTAKCVVLSKAALKGFQSCEHNKDGTFGLSDPAFTCRKSKNSEYVIYKTKTACKRNLETMNANAP